MERKGKTSQRTILFRQNVNRDNEEWAHFLEGYRKWLMDWVSRPATGTPPNPRGQQLSLVATAPPPSYVVGSDGALAVVRCR